MRLRFLVCLLMCGAVSVCGQDHPRGSIAGIVVDSTNHPMADVKVVAVDEHRAHVEVEPSAVADKNGKFRLDGLVAGQYWLFPIFPEGGYPDLQAAIFPGDPGRRPVITVEPGSTLTGVVVTMPKKGARFTASIVDAETGVPVFAARMRVTNPYVPRAFYESGPSVNGICAIVLTTKMAFNVEIHASGYESWRYSDVDSRGIENYNLILEPGAQKEVTVKLHKVKQHEREEQKK